MSLKVLADFHHPELFESFQLTLHDRLGYDLYRPIGWEWWNEDYWAFEKVWFGDRLAQMFLPLRDHDRLVGNHYEREDDRNTERKFKMLTLEQTRDLKPDILISTVPGNHVGFDRLAKEIGAIHVVQIGNNEHSVPWELKPLALVSTDHLIPDGIKFVRYSPEIRQEFLVSTPVPVDGPVGSFNLEWHKQEDLDRYNYVAENNPERPFYLFGWKGMMLTTSEQIARTMREMAVIYHDKSIGDGFGFSLHYSFSLGRPVVGSKLYYRGCRAYPMWQPDSTLDISGMSFADAAYQVRSLLEDPDRMISMGEAGVQRFHELVNYDEDAKKIKELLES